MFLFNTWNWILETGKRGTQGFKKSGRCCVSLSGAEDAMVVNNNAAAVYLNAQGP